METLTQNDHFTATEGGFKDIYAPRKNRVDRLPEYGVHC